jgi:hypothetical protein
LKCAPGIGPPEGGHYGTTTEATYRESSDENRRPRVLIGARLLSSGAKRAPSVGWSTKTLHGRESWSLGYPKIESRAALLGPGGIGGVPCVAEADECAMTKASRGSRLDELHFPVTVLAGVAVRSA